MEELAGTKMELNEEFPDPNAELNNEGPIITFDTTYEEVVQSSREFLNTHPSDSPISTYEELVQSSKDLLNTRSFDSSRYFAPRPIQTFPQTVDPADVFGDIMQSPQMPQEEMETDETPTTEVVRHSPAANRSPSPIWPEEESLEVAMARADHTNSE